jgi:hypothetical protein
MELSIRTISPKMAKEILDKNFSNRRVDKRRVNQYAKDMIEGLWKTNTGEALKITKSNRFVDGQHRLHAIIQANIPVSIMRQNKKVTILKYAGETEQFPIAV